MKHSTATSASALRAPIPANEAERLAFLRDLRLDPSLPYDEIQGLCEVAAKLADAPAALVSLVEDTTQKFLSSVGVQGMKGSRRDIALCAHAIMDSQQFEVADCLLDPRFSSNPLVLGKPGIRCYLGTVLEPEPGIRLGTICVMDTQPRTFPDGVKRSLAQIGRAITALLVSHRNKLDLMSRAEEVVRQGRELEDLTASLQMSVDKITAAERIKSEFMSVINHELRTPLTSIKGSLSLMKESQIIADREKTQVLLDIAYGSSTQLEALVEEILRFREDTCTVLKTPLTPVDLAEVVLEAVNAHQHQDADRDVDLIVSGAERPCIVNGNRTKLEQLLAKLLSNAIKFSRSGGTVEIALTSSEEGPRLAVKDQGVGIPDGSEEAVFGLFTQLDSSDTRSRNGAGFGMYICKKLIEQHDATISYESEVGVGTTFTVQFPRPVLQ